MKLRLQGKAFLLLICVALLVYSFTTYFMRRAQVLEEFQLKTRSIAATGSAEIEGSDVAAILGWQDITTTAFRNAKARLDRIRDLNHLKNEEIYVLRPTDWSIFETEFVLIQPTDYVGKKYIIKEQSRQAFNEAMRGLPSSTKIDKDNHGTWISSFGPIYKSDQIVGILVVDAEVGRFLNKLTNDMLLQGAVALVALVVVLLRLPRIVADDSSN